MKRLLLPLLLLLSSGLHAAVTELNGIVAVVDDDVITRSELTQRLGDVVAQLRQKGMQLPPLKVLQRQMLERMIVEQLQLAQAKQLGIVVDEEHINKVIENIARENGLGLLQFREALQKDGVSFAYFRQQIRNEITITRLRSSQVSKRIDVTPQEVDALLASQQQKQSHNEEYRLQHILISLPTDATPEQVDSTRQRAQQVVNALQQGEDFTKLAISHSQGPQALDGGDIGWRRLAQLPTPFAKALEEMAIGEHSSLIRSGNGFHLLKLVEKRGSQRHIVRQVKARHILLRSSELVADHDAKQRLARLRERILGGEDFSALATAHSEDPGSARNGGDLGWADPSIYVQAFRDALKETAPGKISKPFKSQFGWHILQVQQWREHDNTEEYLRNKAFEALRARKTEEETENWLRSLRDEAYVELRLD